MKIISGLIILVFPGLVIYGQQTRAIQPTPPTPVAAARILTEFSAGAEKIVKGAPFSAEGVSESVQTLADATGSSANGPRNSTAVLTESFAARALVETERHSEP